MSPRPNACARRCRGSGWSASFRSKYCSQKSEPAATKPTVRSATAAFETFTRALSRFGTREFSAGSTSLGDRRLLLGVVLLRVGLHGHRHLGRPARAPASA